VTNTVPAISNFTVGICAALVLGGVVFIVRYGRQCCESVVWIMEMCRSAKGPQALQEEQRSDAERPVEELDRDEILELKSEISAGSKQIKAILVEIKKTRDAELMKALEGDANLALTDYGMKWEVKRVEFEKAMRVMEAALSELPEQAVAYRRNTTAWIAKAREKFDKCTPEELARRIKAAKRG